MGKVVGEVGVLDQIIVEGAIMGNRNCYKGKGDALERGN